MPPVKRPRGLKKSVAIQPEAETRSGSDAVDETQQIAMEDVDGDDLSELQSIYASALAAAPEEQKLLMRATVHEADRLMRNSDQTDATQMPEFYATYAGALMHLGLLADGDPSAYFDTAMQILSMAEKSACTAFVEAQILLHAQKCAINDNDTEGGEEFDQVKALVEIVRQQNYRHGDASALLPLAWLIHQQSEQSESPALWCTEALALFQEILLEDAEQASACKGLGTCCLAMASDLIDVVLESESDAADSADDESKRQVERALNFLHNALKHLEKASLLFAGDQDELAECLLMLCEVSLQLGNLTEDEDAADKHQLEAIKKFQECKSIRPNLISADMEAMIADLSE